MRFTPLILLASALSAVAAMTSPAGNALKARSSKQLLHMLVRNLDEEEAVAVIARYNELSEREADNHLERRGGARCQRCNRVFPNSAALIAHMASAHYGNGGL
ncbi:unnamed protein product [Clonostachys byssicola]|uniref:C2H2-type domain-containing protein n=1 Tax=Clonostachys byssicola TaxID=160290 RepID=A0A9N9XX99_9HYPO|nr:unnamed protein product [Clonostachys byssicola]